MAAFRVWKKERLRRRARSFDDGLDELLEEDSHSMSWHVQLGLLNKEDMGSNFVDDGLDELLEEDSHSMSSSRRHRAPVRRGRLADLSRQRLRHR